MSEVRKEWVYLLIAILVLSIDTAPLVIATAMTPTTHKQNSNDSITILVPDPRSIIIPASYQEYHYVFCENHKTSGGHTVWIRAYHIYVYGTYTKTAVEAQWVPSIWGGYCYHRTFYVYLNGHLSDSIDTTSGCSWPGATQTFYHVLDGGEYLVMSASGDFLSPSASISVSTSCTVPPRY